MNIKIPPYILTNVITNKKYHIMNINNKNLPKFNSMYIN
ncbi:hypothetical protein CLG_B0514 [Clostridium botulinum D str. 1873]|uniref:Uncharacterized protein n=1 Tax=Clostridium botulinum D str. 1873 TaxID=592027 RepID=A0A9P2LM60_CLOBO|nr:hypothetical protein CLG_B0514 [Clostridium botulinum D str. 1873]